MDSIRFKDVNVGDQLPPLAIVPINRTTLALYAGASGDHNPIHIDLDFARKSRMPDVFAHGMLSAAYLGRLLTGWAASRTWATRRCAPAPWWKKSRKPASSACESQSNAPINMAKTNWWAKPSSPCPEHS